MNSNTNPSPRRRRIITISAIAASGALVLGGGAFGIAEASASAATAQSAGPAQVVSLTADTTHTHTPNPDVVKLRDALKAVAKLPKAQRPAAIAKIRAAVKDGTYGQQAEKSLKAIEHAMKGDPAGLRRELLRLSVPREHKAAHAAPTSTPAPSSTGGSSS